jgi:hypothetical protein
MHEPTPEDMAALIDEGSLVDYLLSTGGRIRKKPQQQAQRDDNPAFAAPTSPLHRPGAWPFGLGPPGPNTCHPDCDCAITPKPPATRKDRP